jgi:methyl-accepting chemotaxis protein
MKRFLAVFALASLLCGGQTRAQQSSVQVDGSVALASLVSLADGHLRTVADSLGALAATSSAQSADWHAISAPLAAIAKMNVAGVYFFTKPDGTYWTTTGGLQPVTLSDRAYFKAAMAGHATMGELLRSKSTGREVATIAIPVFGANGKVVGILGGSVFLDQLALLLVREMDLGSGNTFVVTNQNGVVALRSGPGVVGDRPMLFERSKLTGWQFGFGVVRH